MKYYYGMYQAKPHDFSRKKPVITSAPSVPAEANEHLRKYPIKWTASIIEERFEEAIRTLKKLPEASVQGYFNVWPEVIYSGNERIFQEVIGRKLRATPAEVSRLDQVIEWTSWLEEKERKLVWKRAMNIKWKILEYQFGKSRATLWREWSFALIKITFKLNQLQA